MEYVLYEPINNKLFVLRATLKKPLKPKADIGRKIVLSVDGIKTKLEAIFLGKL